MRAVTIVGSVRMIESRRRMRATTTLLWTMFVDAATANGITRTDPMKEPRSDILIVSKSGCHTDGM